jgi:hypothetical protein
MRFFNDDLPKHETSFIFNGNEWGVIKTESEREKERRVRGRAWVKKGCAVGPKLGHWQSTYEGLKIG